MFLLLMTMLATVPAAPHLPIEELSKRFHGYRSATVSCMRLAGSDPTRRGSVGRAAFTVAISSSEVGPRWVERAVDMLLHEPHYHYKGKCAPDCWPESSLNHANWPVEMSFDQVCDSSQVQVTIELGSGPGATALMVLSGSNCFEMLSDSGSVDVFELGSTAGDLLDLVREALPGDSLLQATKPPSRGPERIERPAPDRLKTNRGGLGDLVTTPSYGRLVHILVSVQPTYPEMAEAMMLGTVAVQALIMRDGHVASTKSSNPSRCSTSGPWPVCAQRCSSRQPARGCQSPCGSQFK